MKNVTTFETSQRLKVAGFPQPVPEFGQVWYAFDSQFDESEFKPLIVTGTMTNRSTGETVVYCTFIDGSVREFDSKEFMYFFFSPAATDILRELPNTVYRRYGKAHWQLGELTLPEKGPHIVDFQKSHDENDAEMLAKKWLSLHEKKNICYKTNEVCRYDCGGLCKDSY